MNSAWAFFFSGRIHVLVGPAELHVIAPGVETVASRGRRGKHLQRHGPLHFRVVLRGRLQDVISTEVHHYKLSAVEETYAVSTGLQGLTGDFECDFIEQIGLVFLLDCRGVARAIDESRENIQIVSEVDASAVAVMHRRTLTAKKNAFRENSRRNGGRLEDNLFARGGRVVRSYVTEMPERETQEHEQQENQKPLESNHGNSFRDEEIVQHLVSFRKKK